MRPCAIGARPCARPAAGRRPAPRRVSAMAIATVNGRRVAYEDTGGGGPAVIFSHGLLMDREMFAPQLDALRGEFRCIAWDARGHGESDEATEPFTYWDSAGDMFALAEHLGV